VRDIDLLKIWAEWLGIICKEVRSLLVARELFWEIQAIIAANPKVQTHGLFNNWMATNYAVATAVGIRRQLDTDRRSVSFERLLREIEKMTTSGPSVLSRESFLENYRPELRPAGDAEFNRLVGPNAKQVEPLAVRRDLELLMAATEKVKHYVNKRIAHRDEGVEPAPNLGDLDDSLNALKSLVDKYCRLVTGSGPSLDVLLDPEWKSILRVPWIP
jgi:hypothetical protein